MVLVLVIYTVPKRILSEISVHVSETAVSIWVINKKDTGPATCVVFATCTTTKRVVTHWQDGSFQHRCHSSGLARLLCSIACVIVEGVISKQELVAR